MIKIDEDSKDIKLALEVTPEELGSSIESVWVSGIGGVVSSAKEFGALFSKYEGVSFEEGAQMVGDDLWGVIAPVGQAAGAMIDQSLQNIYAQLQQKRKVKIKSLINLTGGALARSPVEISELINTKVEELLKDFAKTAGTALHGVAKESVYALEEVQAVAQIVSGILNLYYTIKNIGDILEPVFPAVEIVTNAASIFMTGGGSIAEMMSRSGQEAMNELKKLFPLLIYPLKEAILNKEIEVPLLLLGGMQRLQTAEAQQRWDKAYGATEKWLTLDAPAYVSATNDLTWAKNHNAGTSWIENKIIQPYIKNVLSDINAASKLQVRRDNAENIWKSRVGSSAGFEIDPTLSESVPQFMHFNNQEIISLSKELVESADTSMIFYLDRQMHKMIVSELKADGAVVDLEKRTYDEFKTRNNPEGDRGSFKEINKRITSYHTILRALTGEIRANITEEIPVIDFYRKKLTSLKYRYMWDDITKISTIEEKSCLDPLAPTASYLLKNDSPYFINYALNQYDPKLHFYNTKASIPRLPSIQVDYASTGDEEYTLRASGLLNGLFTSPATYASNGDDVETWKWDLDGDINYQELAATYGMEISPGVKYSPAHLVGGLNDAGTASRRHIINKPLEDPDDPTRPGWGLAQKNYEGILFAVETQLIAQHEIAPSVWKTLGGFVEDVTSPLDKGTRVEVSKKKKVDWGFEWTLSRWPWTRSVSYESVMGWASDAMYPEKMNYFLEDENRFKASMWSNKASGSTLQLNIDNYPADISILAKNMPSPVLRRFLWWTYWGTQYTTYETSWTDHASRVFRVHLNGLHGRSGAPAVIIEKIECIMPQEVIRKKSTPVDVWYTAGTLKQARLFIPEGSPEVKNSGSHYFPQRMILISKYPLGFEVGTKKNLCTLYHENAMFFVTVTNIEYIKSPAEYDNFTVTYGDKTYTYTKGVSHISGKPEVSVQGVSCYVYTLKAKEISYGLDSLDMFPAKEPRSFITIKNGEWTSIKEDVATMKGMDIAVGIPTVVGDNYKLQKRNRSSNSFRLMDTLSGRDSKAKDSLRTILRQALKDLPIITTDEMKRVGEDATEEIYNPPDITLEQMPEIIRPLIEAKDDFRLLNNSTLNGSITNFVQRISDPKFLTLHSTVVNLVEKIDSSSDLLEQCILMDSVLGNDADPWLMVGEDPEDDISEGKLQQITSLIKNSLEGQGGGVPVRYLPGQTAPLGSPDSLYYQRYLFLNNRMHWTSGHLAQAAQRIMNWEDATTATSIGSNRLEAYKNYIKTTPVVDMPLLEYFIEDRDDENNIIRAGKFYEEEILQNVKDSLHDKCLLVCIPCPVADTCPFFGRDLMIREFVPEADSVELWLKDNELNLIAYEQIEGQDYLDVKTADGKLLDIEQFKNRQKAYVEIVQDEDKDFALENVREKIAKEVDGFQQGDSYIDELGWLQGGRYGSLMKIGKDADITKNYRYLYDAIFVRDEDSEFIYTNSQEKYPVEVNYIENTLSGVYEAPTVYTGEVRIKIPTSLKIFEDAGPSSDVYLVSDDWKDVEGKAIEPLIYINTLENVKFTFDLNEDTLPATESVNMEHINEDPSPQDIAQWHINTYKWMSEGYDQWWMPKVMKKTEDGRNITLEGRKRAPDVIDPLVSETPNLEEVLNGKPFVNSYVNFLRKVRIQLDCFKWVKGVGIEDPSIEIKKQTLQYMRTNVRLVVIKK